MPRSFALVAALLAVKLTAAYGVTNRLAFPFGTRSPASAAMRAKPTASILTKPRPADVAKPSRAAAALPVLSYASLGMVTAGAAKLILPALAGPGVALLGGCISLPMILIGSQIFSLGGPGIAKAMGGKPAGDRLTTMANDAADALGVPRPAHVMLIDSPEPNAFAAGLSTKDATVAVTSALQSALSYDEMRAVLAHEMGHVRHKDMNRNIHITLAVAGLGGVYEAGRILLDSSSRESSSKSKKDKDNEGSAAGLGLALMAGGATAQGVAHLLKMGASRNAELQADRAAAEAFGADALISALKKIDRQARSSHGALQSTAMGRAMAFSMISDGPSSMVSSKPKSRSWWSRTTDMLRTHPRLDVRVDALEQLRGSGSGVKDEL